MTDGWADDVTTELAELLDDPDHDPDVDFDEEYERL
ncbi:hypothetical protein J2S55_007956 [Streptosporangium brasiliense]|uniref:Uncharacterized protein n=1 Tax=Streptosporangium brasiliense TaxID=47480 RepID=A0ABT9RK48_9ACTN|nr:hypothetical protein [Streptosporangium brasiliense]